MSKGVIDGAVIPYQVVPSIKVNELAKFAAETDPKYNALYTTVFVIAMNKAKYDSLAPELKKVIDANGGADASAWVGKVWDQSATGARKLASDRGNQFNTIGVEELQKWEKVGQVVVDSWISEVTAKGFDGKALLKSARELIQKNEQR